MAGREEKAIPDSVLRMKRLGLCIRNRRAELEMTQGDLAAKFEDDYGKPLMQTTVSRWELGQVSLTAEQIRNIEEALGLPAGHLLAAAGYVDLAVAPDSVEAMVLADPALDPEYRDMVVTFYRQMRKASELSRITRPKGKSRRSA